MIKTLISVAGFDPSAGAGVLLDTKVFNHFGFHGAAVLTSLTAQDTKSVRELKSLPSRFILGQFEALKSDLRVAGVKFGMSGGRAGLRAMEEILFRSGRLPTVVDPVFRSSSGFWLMGKDAIGLFLRVLGRGATLVTPNIPEAELMIGLKVGDLLSQENVARAVFERTGVACLVKGGHRPGGGLVSDVLFDGRRPFRFSHRRIAGDVHGTGCFLSSAILARLAGGDSLERACRAGVALTSAAMRRARLIGGGRSILTGPWPRPSARR